MQPRPDHHHIILIGHVHVHVLSPAQDLELHNDFLPLLREVLGRAGDQAGLPKIIIEGEAAAPDVEAEKAAAATAAAAAAAVEARSSKVSPAVASVSFRGPGSISYSRVTPPAEETTVQAGEAQPQVPELRVSTEAVLAVSRALMGRLDVVDLVGRNTAEEVAERVRVMA